MKLILVRHGETPENKKGILQGHLNSSLSKEGIKQAKKLSLRLKNEKIDKIFVSDLKRTVQTAKELIKYHPNTEVIYEQMIRERDLGNLQGRSLKELIEESKKSGLSMFKFKPKRGESHSDLKKRIKKFFRDLMKKESGKTILLVTHGGPIAHLLLYFLKLPFKKIKECKSGHTGISIIEVDINDGNHKINLINCTKHLEK